MEEPRGAKLNEIIKQLGLNESVNNENTNGNSKANKLANVHRISARGKGLKFVPVKRPGKSLVADDTSIEFHLYDNIYFA